MLSCRVLSAHDLSRLRRTCLGLYAATWQRELIPEITEALLLGLGLGWVRVRVRVR